MGAEVVVELLIVVAGILLLLRLRHERRLGAASTSNPLFVGIYRGCAFIIILLAAYAWASIVLGWILGRP
jgi:hypothetical protein